MYPNSALSVWQLLVMTSVPVALLVLCLILVRLAGRDRGRCSCPRYDPLAETEVAAGGTAGAEIRWDAGQRAA